MTRKSRYFFWAFVISFWIPIAVAFICYAYGRHTDQWAKDMRMEIVD